MLTEERLKELVVKELLIEGWTSPSDEVHAKLPGIIKRIYEMGRQEGSEEVKHVIRRLRDQGVSSEVIAGAVFEEDDE